MSNSSSSPHAPDQGPDGDSTAAGGACGCGHEHADGNPPHHHDDSGEGSEPAADREWTRRFFLFLEMSVLLIWAVAMVFLYASGRINYYLVGEGTFRIQVLIGGLLLAVLGIFNWQARAVAVDCGHDHGAEPDCGHDHASVPGHHHSHEHGHEKEHGHGHGHGHGDSPEQEHGHKHDHGHVHDHSHDHEGTPGGRGLALAVLALSVTAAVAMTPDDFSDQYKKNMLSAYRDRAGSDTATPDAYRLTPADSPTAAAAGGMTIEVVEKYRPRNKEGNFELGVEELYYSSADPEYAKVMKGQGVETIGQVVKDTAEGGTDRWRVFVLQMTCCAADARPVSLPVEFTTPVEGLQEMGWFKIAGTIDYVEERGIPIAVLRATSATPSLRPKEQRSMF